VWWVAGFGQAVIGAIWNFVVSAALVWRVGIGGNRRAAPRRSGRFLLDNRTRNFLALPLRNSFPPQRLS
jgi:hypothetical protein